MCLGPGPVAEPGRQGWGLNHVVADEDGIDEMATNTDDAMSIEMGCGEESKQANGLCTIVEV